MSGLTIDSCLVYPNPCAGPTAFTFRLNRSAFVAVRIYTIAGRLVRSLPAQPCGFGYNMLEWDGFDEHGRAPANGVYLYKLVGNSSELVGDVTQNYSASHQDKFLIHR